MSTISSFEILLEFHYISAALLLVFLGLIIGLLLKLVTTEAESFGAGEVK